MGGVESLHEARALPEWGCMNRSRSCDKRRFDFKSPAPKPRSNHRHEGPPLCIGSCFPHPVPYAEPLGGCLPHHAGSEGGQHEYYLDLWRVKSKAELRAARQQLWDACTNLQLRPPGVRELVLARLCDADVLLPEIHFDLEEAHAIAQGHKRETARAVRECSLLLSGNELALHQRVERYEMPGRQMSYAEANEAAEESAAASARLASTLTGCCVRAMMPGPCSPQKFAILQVTRVDQISSSFTVLDFAALHLYMDVSMHVA